MADAPMSTRPYPASGRRSRVANPRQRRDAARVAAALRLGPSMSKTESDPLFVELRRLGFPGDA